MQKMDPQKSEELSSEFGQRIRLHILMCELHMAYREKINDSTVRKLKLKLDYYPERPEQIYKELQHSKYIQYATIVISLNTVCNCRSLLLRKVLQKLKLNQHLRYKTKLIFSSYHHGYPYRRLIGPKGSKFIASYFYDNSPGGESVCIPFMLNEYESMELMVTERTRRDLNIFREANVDNIFFMQTYSKNYVDREKRMFFMLGRSIFYSFVSLNEMLVDGHTGVSFTHTTASADLYFFSINPALAIIVNNYYFTNTEEVRVGSEQDVRRLIRELKIAQIPFMLIQDSGRAELLHIIDYMQQKNFHPLKSLLFFIMSHGDANNVIYTHDGQLDLIEDIVQPIQSNPSLKDANKFIIVTSCRGTIDMEYADYNDLNKIKNSNNTYSLDDNTVILRSIPELVMSPRDPVWGTPFMRSFCQRFRHIDHTQDIRIVHSRLENDLQNEPYYEYLKKRLDLIVGNATCSHCVIHPRIEAQEMLELIKSIREEYPSFQGRNIMINEAIQGIDRHRQSRSLFYVCGSVKEWADPSTISFTEIYFSPELDEEDKEDLHQDKKNYEFDGK